MNAPSHIILHSETLLGPTCEADHRIANSLAVISGLVRVRARAANDVADPRTFLLEIADRIDTVAHLHRLLAQSDTGNIGLAQHLEEICNRLGSALAPGALYYIKCPPDLIVPFRVAMPLGLISAELFSNSLKYAHPTGLPVRVDLCCTRIGAAELELTYQDDGVGLPEKFDVSSDGNLGMLLIRTLTNQLKGSHEWSSDPLGLTFRMTVPV